MSGPAQADRLHRNGEAHETSAGEHKTKKSGEFLEFVPHELIRYTDEVDDPNLPGVMHVTVSLKAVSVGTEINVEQSGVPAAIPVEGCYLGWQQSLAQLVYLVEPDIPE